MKEVDHDTPIEKSEFIFRREFMAMVHNYLCACCKEKSAVQDMNTGILQPCWDCQKEWKVQPVYWWTKFLSQKSKLRKRKVRAQ